MRANSVLLDSSSGELNERWRRYGLIASLLGAVILATLVLTLNLNNSATLALNIAAVPAAGLLVVTAVSCWKNFRVRTVLFLVLLSLYLIIWIAGFLEILYIQIQIHAFAFYFFLPLLVVSMMNHNAIFALAPVQFILVFLATVMYAQEYYLAKYSSTEQTYYLALVCAALSALSFLMTGLISWIRDISDKKLLNVIEEKRALANTDSLTGLSNRRAFFETLDELWQQKEPFVLAYLDLLRFKPLNDQFGHAAGDVVLKELAERLRQSPGIRLAARVGGDEFAFVLNKDIRGDAIAPTISEIYTRLIGDINSEFGVLNVGTSIGCVEAFTDVASLPMLTSAADTAMRRARNRRLPWVRYNKDVDEASLTTAAIELAFKQALRGGKIRAAVQPVACAKTGEIVCYELLSRWIDSGFPRNPTPDQFVPIAEKLGLLNELLWHTLEETLSLLELKGAKLSINVSPGQLTSTDLLPKLLKILRENNISTETIILEVTEQVAFRNLETNVDVLKQARSHGMLVALDDFGTGYASLSIVDALPLDKIKIDRSFVQPADRGSRRDTLLGAAIQMCRQLDLTCCVEGVETQAVAESVVALGADELQGYLIGRPRLVKDLTRLNLVA